MTDRAGIRALAGFGLVLATFGTSAAAQVSPNGDEIQVNSYTTSYQWLPSVAAHASGEFVVVWASAGSLGTDVSDQSIQARRHRSDGSPVGEEFQVNDYTTSQQVNPVVAVDDQGGFIVAWISAGSSGTDDLESSVQARRFDAQGAPLGAQFQVNTYTYLSQNAPAIDSGADGSFVIVWQSYGSSGTDTDGTSVQARRFDASGTPLGDDFQVNSHTTSYQVHPDVANSGPNGFVVTWESDGSSGSDTSLSSIQAQGFAENGEPVGNQFQVNAYTTNNQERPGIAADVQGNFIIAWSSAGSNGGDTSSYSVQVQRFDADGTPLGAQFQVNSYEMDDQKLEAVSLDGQGRLVVGWRSRGSDGGDASNESIQARRYDSDGSPLGGEFQVNAFTLGRQANSEIAADSRGNFVVVWESDGSSGTDTSYFSVQAQRFDALFRDGFASGDTGRWSTAAP